MPRDRPARMGFTLLEVVVVVSVLGLLLTIALPGFARMREALAVDSAVQQFEGDLRRAQIEALRGNRVVELSRTGPSTYTVEGVGDRNLPERVSFGQGSSEAVRFAPFGPPIGGSEIFVLVSPSGRRASVGVGPGGLVGAP